MNAQHSIEITCDPAYIRKARKQWHCCGGHNGRHHTKCDAPILKGEQYIEYCGESYPFESGKRYHIGCAEQQGIIKLLPDAAIAARKEQS